MKRINPNHITLFRLIVAAPMACIFLSGGYLWFALATMAIGELTDFLDGFVARRTDQVSDVGKLLDPLCDSVFHMTIWMTFLSIGWAPLWAVVLFFTRDAIISTIRSCLVKHGITLAARWSGKIKAVFQGGSLIILVILHILLDEKKVSGIQTIIILAAVIATIWSFIDYSLYFYGEVKKKKVVFVRGAKA